MISLQQISYNTHGRLILDHVSAGFEPGKLNLVLGANGAGKSTLLKLISGQLPATNGSLYYGDKNITELPVRRLAKMRAVLSQNIELAFPLKVSEVVMMGRYPHFTERPGTTDQQACEEAMQFFDVSAMAGRNYMSLSEGEKQRVQFARVLAQIWWPVPGGCRYLLLDEPLTFLDIYYQVELMKKLQELKRQTGLVIIGIIHDLNLAARFGDRLLLLKDGKVLAEGEKQAVLTPANLKAAYNLEPVIHTGENGMYLYFG